ncbi:hypothetical protein ABK040_012512 [Willaertia magna]
MQNNKKQEEQQIISPIKKSNTQQYTNQNELLMESIISTSYIDDEDNILRNQFLSFPEDDEMTEQQEFDEENNNPSINLSNNNETITIHQLDSHLYLIKTLPLKLSNKITLSSNTTTTPSSLLSNTNNKHFLSKLKHFLSNYLSEQRRGFSSCTENTEINHEESTTNNLAPTRQNTKNRREILLENFLGLLEWIKDSFWDVVVFHVFDCIFVILVLFLMKRILPKRCEKYLQWLIDPTSGFEEK